MRSEELKEIKNRLLEKLLSYTYMNIDSGILFVKNTYRLYKFIEYRKHMKRTEAFFERGRLYQFVTKEAMPLYGKEDIDRYIKNVESGNIETLQTIPYFTHFVLS
ncbi:MAG: hypothetical protein EB023_12565, partial [Flavobacteriia bacterium]|nr:hypothetical protein [Flavobacteriia bacterium]